MKQKVNFYPLRKEDFTIMDLGKHPDIPKEQQIKVSAADVIGYAQTESEAIQLIDKLRTW